MAAVVAVAVAVTSIAAATTPCVDDIELKRKKELDNYERYGKPGRATKLVWWGRAHGTHRSWPCFRSCPNFQTSWHDDAGHITSSPFHLLSHLTDLYRGLPSSMVTNENREPTPIAHCLTSRTCCTMWKTTTGSTSGAEIASTFFSYRMRISPNLRPSARLDTRIQSVHDETRSTKQHRNLRRPGSRPCSPKTNVDTPGIEHQRDVASSIPCR